MSVSVRSFLVLVLCSGAQESSDVLLNSSSFMNFVFVLPSGFFRTVQALWSTQTCSRSSAYAQKLHKLNVPLLLTNHKHLIPVLLLSAP